MTEPSRYHGDAAHLRDLEEAAGCYDPEYDPEMPLEIERTEDSEG